MFMWQYANVCLWAYKHKAYTRARECVFACVYVLTCAGVSEYLNACG